MNIIWIILLFILFFVLVSGEIIQSNFKNSDLHIFWKVIYFLSIGIRWFVDKLVILIGYISHGFSQTYYSDTIFDFGYESNREVVNKMIIFIFIALTIPLWFPFLIDILKSSLSH